MFITGNFYGLAVEHEQAYNPVEVIRCQAGISVEGKGAFLRKADNTATGIEVVVMHLEAVFGWC